jgi:hypothetical protein
VKSSFPSCIMATTSLPTSHSLVFLSQSFLPCCQSLGEKFRRWFSRDLVVQLLREQFHWAN